jgi:hypothetical protein
MPWGVSQGASTAALPYFICLGFQLPPNENPADFFLDIVSGCVACHANPDFQIEVSTYLTSSAVTQEAHSLLSQEASDSLIHQPSAQVIPSLLRTLLGRVQCHSGL